MESVLNYLNPIRRLGIRKYSIFFPTIIVLVSCILLEIYAYFVLNDPQEIGIVAIFVLLSLIIYFAFRDGIRGGFISSILTTTYFLYIIYSRNYTDERLTSGIQATIILSALFLLVGGTIGGLKEKIDKLIDQEANEKKRLQTIVEQLPVGVLLVDNKGNFIQANKRLESIFGQKIYTDISLRDEILNNLKYKDKAINLKQWPLTKSLMTGKSIRGKEFTFTKDDGKNLYLRISSALIHNRNRQVIAAASIVNDITDRKELESRKDDFINMASHELKTPLTSMKLYIDSLLIKLKDNKDEKAVKTLTSIKNQTNRLQELASDLLDVSRLQTGKLNFIKEKFALASIIKESINELEGLTNRQKIVFIQNSSPSILADRFRIYQVLTNLITNAIKYSPAGTTITITLKKTSDKAIVSVKDEGIGIDKNQHKKIFDRLYQVTDPHEKTFPGLGMGLYISKEIIKKHKGTIWVESEKSKGTTFYFSLPLYKKGV